MRELTRKVRLRCLVYLVLGGGLPTLAHSFAVAGESPVPACPDEPCAVRTGRELLYTGRTDEARVFLKARAALLPDSGPIHVLLAVAYATAGNHSWAIRTLSARVQNHPEDCEARTWLAWEYLQLGSRDLAAETLPADACPPPGPLAVRALLLRGLASPASSPEGREALDRARRSPEAWESDRAALPALTRVVDPARPPELAWGLEAAVGYTTDARLGAPSDPAAGTTGDVGSGLFQSNVWVRAMPDFGGPIRPAGEVQVRMLRFFAADASGLSYLNVTGRLGLLAGRSFPRVLVGYRPDFLLLSQGDRFDAGPVWYVGGHRGEVELEVTPGLLVTAGGGHRRFRELGRTHWEVDASVAGQASFHKSVRFLWALSGRRHFTTEASQSLWGLTALVNLSVRLPGRWSVAASASAFADWYPDSAGHFGADERNEVAVRPGLVAWTPPFAGGALGLGYEYSRRLSSVVAYDYADHRVLLKLRWGGSADLNVPARAATRPLADLPWGLAAEGSDDAAEERVQDLLRQDEQVQNVCGCGQ